jgi:hypothetical protein
LNVEATPETFSSEARMVDDDNDGYFDEDPVDGVDNDGDGLVDEDPAIIEGGSELPADNAALTVLAITVTDEFMNPAPLESMRIEIVEGSGTLGVGRFDDKDDDGLVDELIVGGTNFNLADADGALTTTITATGTGTLQTNAQGRVISVDAAGNQVKPMYRAGTEMGDLKIKVTALRTGSEHEVNIVLLAGDQSAPHFSSVSLAQGAVPVDLAVQGADLTLTVEISDTDPQPGVVASGVISATLYYIVGGTTKPNTLDMTLTAGNALVGDWSAVIPKDHVTVRGLSYYIEAMDRSTNVGLLSSSESPIFIPVSGSIAGEQSDTLPLQVGDTVVGWVMVAPPVDADDPNAMFEPFNRVLRWDANRQNWEDGVPSMPGSGAFVLGSGQSLNASGTSRDITNPFTISLKSGWNIVGNPFSFGRYWNDETITIKKDNDEVPITEATDRGWVYHTIWWFDHALNDYEEASSNFRVQPEATALSPFSGFWVLAFQDVEMMVSPTAFGPNDVPPIAGAPTIANGRSAVVLDNIKPPVLPKDLVIPEVTEVYQNYPNPFNPDTWIPYQLSTDANIVIDIYNVNGDLVRVLELGPKSAGVYLTKEKAAHWNGRNKMGEKIASGLYFYQLRTSSFTSPVKRMLILK